MVEKGRIWRDGNAIVAISLFTSANTRLQLLNKKLWAMAVGYDYGSLNVNRITDYKNFWRVVKPNFVYKIVGINRVILRDGGKVISDTEKVADTFNKFFAKIGNTLKINKNERFLVETNDVFDPVLKAVKKDSAHPRIFSIKER